MSYERTRPTITAVAVALSLAVAGCSSDGDTNQTSDGDKPAAEPPPSTIYGAADGVADGSEGGYDLDNLNVPGTESDDELDDSSG